MEFAKFFMINRYKKLQIHCYIKDKNIVDIEKCKEIVNGFLKKDINNIFEIFNNIDLTKVIKNVDKLNTFYDCQLIEGNVCWISKSLNGHYRYFTRSKSKVTYSLDFIDIYGILSNVYSFKLFKKIINDFNLTSIKSEFELKEEAKINQNLKIINELIKTEESVKEVLSSSLKIYKILCEENKNKLINKKFESNNNSIFFSSLEFLKHSYKLNISKSTISKHINLLATLGLITKIKLNQLDNDILIKSLKIQSKKYNHISFYSINKLDEKCINEIKEISQILCENNIKYYKINEKLLFNVFGKNFSEKIFVQKFKKSRKYYEKKEEYTDTINIIELLFKSQLVDFGFASKELIKENVIISKKEFNKIWNNLLDKYLLNEIRPNKNIKKKYNLKKYEPIVILRKEIFSVV